jgi:hypothetical protein
MSLPANNANGTHNHTTNSLVLPTSEWEASEYKQLNQFAQQGVRFRPYPRPSLMPPFNWVWTTTSRPTKPKRKRPVASAIVPPRGGQVRTLDHTYASCVDQSAPFFALSASENKRIYGADLKNAFAEAPPLRRLSTCGSTCLSALVDYIPLTPLRSHTDTSSPVQRALQGHRIPSSLGASCQHHPGRPGFVPTFTHESPASIGALSTAGSLYVKSMTSYGC